MTNTVVRSQKRTLVGRDKNGRNTAKDKKITGKGCITEYRKNEGSEKKHK
jgi:hypothetical protein